MNISDIVIELLRRFVLPNSGIKNPSRYGTLYLLISAQLLNRISEGIMTKAQHIQKPSTLTTTRSASRVQAAVARSTGGSVPKGSHVGRLQAAAAKNSGKSGAK